MKSLHQIKDKIVAAAMLSILSTMSYADNNLQLTNIQGSTGAGSNDISALMTKGQTTFQNIVNFALIGFAAIGILLVGFSLWGIYKAQKDQRDSPKTAIAGLIIGALLTTVALVVGLLRNTVTV